MQIDFHHAVTYVTARLAGFDQDEANIISTAAQYVDDATTRGMISFDNKAMYVRTSSAHTMLDPGNMDNLKNMLVWLPFHFLPGNGGLGPGKDPHGTFIEKIICLPGEVRKVKNRNYIARDMIKAALAVRSKDNALHRLGITLHVYGDTWAHHGFAGVRHAVNDVKKMEESSKPKVTGILDSWVPNVGHGQAKSMPDMPFGVWKYQNGRGDSIERNNLPDFCAAAEAMYRFQVRFRTGCSGKDAAKLSIPDGDMKIISGLFADLKEADGEKRHKKWLQAIAEGRFSFGAERVSYTAKGAKSWKAIALGTSDDRSEYRYNADFLTSDWKYFHDALQQHWSALVHDIFPKYGICAG
jgi:hypothetical protein